VSSTIPAVRAALAAQLPAVTAGTTIAGQPAPTQVIYGPREAAAQVGPLVLSIGPTRGMKRLDAMTLASTEERYTQTLTASCSLAGADSQQLAVETACQVWQLVEAWLRANPTLAGTAGVLQALPAEEFELIVQADEDGRHAAMRFGVAIVAQTTT
jgi:hypothetical protein